MATNSSFSDIGASAPIPNPSVRHGGSGKGVTSGARPKRILIVDDSQLMRAMFRVMLRADKAQEWEVTEASGGEELLRALALNGPFDIVLLDVQMPGMDCFVACKALREVNTQVPVVFVTAESDFRNFAKGRSAGGDSYLVKPVSHTSLKSALAALTGLKRRG